MWKMKRPSIIFDVSQNPWKRIGITFWNFQSLLFWMWEKWFQLSKMTFTVNISGIKVWQFSHWIWTAKILILFTVKWRYFWWDKCDQRVRWRIYKVWWARNGMWIFALLILFQSCLVICKSLAWKCVVILQCFCWILMVKCEFFLIVLDT